MIKWFRNISIKVKLITGFALLTVVLILLQIIGFKSTNQIFGYLEEVTEIRLPSINYLVQADRDLQQLLVAERSLMFTDKSSDKFPVFMKEYTENKEQSDKRWNLYKDLSYLDVEKPYIKEYEAARKKWEAESQKLIDDINSGDPVRLAKARQNSQHELKALFESMRDPMDKLQEVNLQIAEDNKNNGIRDFKKTSLLTLIIALSGLSITIFLAISIIVNISGSLKKLNTMLMDIAQGEGDLTKRVNIGTEDEIGHVAKWFNLFIDKLQNMIKDISNNTVTLASSGTELNIIAEEMKSSVEKTVDKSNSVSAATEEMSSNMDSVSDTMDNTTDQLNTVSSGTEEMSSSINEIAKNASKSTDITKNAVKQAMKASDQVSELAKAAEEIVKVTDTIAEISNQTNLLALNATIEAARAGDAGKGFAVVANEIKELARQTASATEEIAKKLTGVQTTSKITVSEIQNITGVINEIDNVVGAIAAAVEQQNATTSENAKGIAEITTKMNSVKENIEQTSQAAGQIAEEISDVNNSTNEMGNSAAQVQKSSEELSQMVENLKYLVGQFKV